MEQAAGVLLLPFACGGLRVPPELCSIANRSPIRNPFILVLDEL
jgi:hypothetical protein